MVDSGRTPGERLRWARERAGFATAIDFAKAVKIKAVSYRAYEADQNGFAKLAFDFGDRLGVDPQWLLKGDGTPGDGVPKIDPDTIAKDLGLALIPQLELGYSMGGGSVFQEYEQTGFIPFQRDWLRSLMRGAFADLFVARGEGDSMTPTMLDGDIVLIDTAQKDVRQQDRIWALSYGDLGMIKRVRKLPTGEYRILSDNPSIVPFDVADGEMHVVGRVIWVGRRM